MYILTQKNGPALLLELIQGLRELELKVASWTSADDLKALFENAPEQSAVAHIYFKRYLELVAPEALQKARRCVNTQELQILIDSAEFKSIEQEAYVFVQESEMNERDALIRASECTTEAEARILLASAEEDSSENVIYEQLWLEFHLK